MSRWLQSVNSLLDSLDGQAENATTDAPTLPTSRGALNQVLTRRGLTSVESGVEEYYDDDYYDEDYEEEDEAEDEEVVFDDSQKPPSPTLPPIIPSTQAVPQDDNKDLPDEATPPEKPSSQDIETVQPDLQRDAVENETQVEKDVAEKQHEQVDAQKPSTGNLSVSSLGVSPDVTQLQQQLKRYKVDLKKSQSEARQLRKHVMQLNTQLESTEAEVAAQRDELQRAAERMEKDRQRAHEEREDILDDHDEELETQKEQYEKMLQDQKEGYEEQIDDLQERLERVEEKRKQEDGDWTKELEDAVEREREALKKLGETRDESSRLKSIVARLEAQQTALQNKLESTSQSLQTANDRERQVEDKLDATLSMHSRQLSQRQARESELERTIADLGAVLAATRQKEKTSLALASAAKDGNSSQLKEQYDSAIDDLETVRAQLMLETERCEALRQELGEINQERTEEAAESHARQRQHDREVANLNAAVSRLEASLRDRPVMGNSNAPAAELETARQQITSLSEQLIRLQAVAENYKTEVLAMKSRLQSANARAENAETALATTNSNVFEVEASGVAYGGATMRKRVKGGRQKGRSAHVRSIRSALELGPGRVGESMEQFAVTIDAIDGWIVDTGGFLKQEPLARLALFLYLCILHLWSFCLVIFHAHSYEEVHGDFGSMADPGGAGPASLLRHSHQP